MQAPVQLNQEQLDKAVAYCESELAKIKLTEELSKTPDPQSLGDGAFLRALVTILLKWFQKQTTAVTPIMVNDAVAYCEEELTKDTQVHKMRDKAILQTLIPILIDWFTKNIPQA